MISVIVPVYNVEPYLEKCLDSICAQTCRDLEILLIDDGSADQSGVICDEYAARDPRIRVFHTENRGLSAARNLGLDEAKGEYIGFVDSDDWIEPDLYEYLLEAAGRTGADVTECGVFREFPDRTLKRERKDRVMSGADAVRALVSRELSDGVWNKLYRRRCFESIRYPEGRVYEEYATMYRVLSAADRVCGLPETKYHYRQRPGSITETRDMKNFTCYWRAHYERYISLWDQADQAERRALLRFCAKAACRAWAYYDDCTPEEKDACRETLREVHAFTKQNLPLFGSAGWRLRLRVASFFPHFYNGLSFRTAWMMNNIYHKLAGKRTGGAHI